MSLYVGDRLVCRFGWNWPGLDGTRMECSVLRQDDQHVRPNRYIYSRISWQTHTRNSPAGFQAVLLCGSQERDADH